MKNFDYNATTPMTDSAVNAWMEINRSSWYNPSSSYVAGIRTKAILKKTRQELASLFGIESDSLIFCSGATEACNLWIQSFFNNDYFSDKHLLVSNQEHSCVRKSAAIGDSDRLHWFSPTQGDVVSKVAELLDMQPEIGAVVMMAANNETGIIYPWREVAKLCRDRGVAYFCDASQWIGKLPVDGFDELDFFCGSAHKFGGPKGTGFLKISKRFPFVGGSKGGGQEFGLRAGTEDLPSIASMIEALKVSFVLASSDEIEKRREWKTRFIQRIQAKFSKIVIHGENYKSLWNTVCVALPEKDARQWLEALDKSGFMVSAGSACSSSSQNMSPVLKDMGVDQRVASRTVRISSGWNIREEEWDALFQAICSIGTDWLDRKIQDTNVISIDDL